MDKAHRPLDGRADRNRIGGIGPTWGHPMNQGLGQNGQGVGKDVAGLGGAAGSVAEVAHHLHHQAEEGQHITVLRVADING